jgi:WD40 repeat protein
VATAFRVYSGNHDGMIRGRDPISLSILDTYQGHQDAVMSLCLDDSNVLFSSSLDGSVKKWNMLSRKVSFSYENRNGSATALAAASGFLFVGTRQGLTNIFSISNGYLIKSTSSHKSTVTSITHFDGVLYSTGLDGIIYELLTTDPSKSVVIYENGSFPIASMSLNMLNLFAIRGENDIVILPRISSNTLSRSIHSSLPLDSIAASDDIVFAGSRAGSIFAYSATSFQNLFALEDHTSQVNSLLVAGSILYSASNDKSIIKWSLEQRRTIFVFKRYSATALGHLGPVNSLTLCEGSLFSAGSDLTTRRWNTITGRHEDVYFGPTKPVTSVVCYNGSVFAGSEDFSVLMYSPDLPLNVENKSTKRTATTTRRGVRTKVASKLIIASSEILGTSVLVGGIIAIVLLVALAVMAFFYRSSKAMKQKERILPHAQEVSNLTTDLETVINTVVGISKHAAFLIETSALALTKRIAVGGGGELFLASVMDPALRNKIGTTVIQKTLFIKNDVGKEAFYQEVGIMVMLLPFQNFCRMLGYTEKPCSIILEYYPDGSLSEWIRTRKSTRAICLKVLKEISQGLNVMHSHYLAHCDLKPQNVLIQVSTGIPTCFITDFGITQVLSESIIAAKSFHIMNLRGLSVHYASPEAFKSFRTKNYSKVNFKMFDVYSFGCVAYEVQTSKTPWL